MKIKHILKMLEAGLITEDSEIKISDYDNVGHDFTPMVWFDSGIENALIIEIRVEGT